MKIVVCVKWVGALGDDVEFDDAGRSVDPDYLDYALNEWDACATEEALRLRDSAGGEVVAVTVGDKDAERALVQCVAMGADRAVRVAPGHAEPVDPLTIAWLISEAVGPEQPDLVLCGAQSSDAMQGATGTALAAFLGLPCATVVTRVEVASSSRAVVRRELEGGLIDVVEIDTPAVLTVQTGINEPRYVTLRAVHQARRMPIFVVNALAETAGASGYRVRSMYVPPRKRAEFIEGGPRAVAARITELVREATA